MNALLVSPGVLQGRPIMAPIRSLASVCVVAFTVCVLLHGCLHTSARTARTDGEPITRSRPTFEPKVKPQSNSADCAIQFFATGMQGKSVDIIVDVSYPNTPVTAYADFGVEKAIAFFTAPEAFGDIDVVAVQAFFDANYSGCTFETLVFQQVFSAGGTGNCYTVEQDCGSYGVTPYGTMYVDIWCQLTSQPAPVRMNYSQTSLGFGGSGVGEVLNC